MRNKILSSLLLTMIAVALQAQELVADYPTVNCGKTAYMIPVTATFELKNRSTKPLSIVSVHPDCGCTKVSVSKNELKGGEKCVIKMSYDARMLGHFEKTVAVTYSLHSRHSSTPPLQHSYTPALLHLKMTGVVLTEVKDYSGIYPFTLGGDLLTDKNVLEFDDVNQGDRPQQILNIFNNGDRPMTPNVQHLPSYLSAEVTPTQLHPGKSGKVVLTLNSQNIHDFGLTQSSVFLASQLGEKVSPENEIPVSVVLLPDLKSFEGKNMQYAPKMELSDSVVTLGFVDGKTKKKAEIIISNHGRIPLDISSLQMFTGGLQLTLNKQVLQPGEQTKLKIVGNLQQLKKARSKPRILMITNDPAHAKVVIPILCLNKN